MYFFIADISGYTAYMLKNKMDYAHGTLIINELMHMLVSQVELPIEISKLEGDAIFLYLPEAKAREKVGDVPHLLGSKILQFFEAFSEKLLQLQNSTACDCGSCSNIDKLNLKVIAHYGKAAINVIGTFHELSGVDVIIAHRLLKNQIKEKRYLLLTQQAYDKLSLPQGAHIVRSEEKDKDLGVIPIYIYYPKELKSTQEALPLTFTQNVRSHLKLSLGRIALKWGLKKSGPFNNLPTSA